MSALVIDNVPTLTLAGPLDSRLSFSNVARKFGRQPTFWVLLIPTHVYKAQGTKGPNEGDLAAEKSLAPKSLLREITIAETAEKGRLPSHRRFRQVVDLTQGPSGRF